MNDDEINDSTAVWALRQEHATGAFIQTFCISVCSDPEHAEQAHYHVEQMIQSVFESLNSAMEFAQGIAETSAMMGFTPPVEVDLETVGL